MFLGLPYKASKYLFNIHGGRDKMDAILQTEFSNVFSWKEIVVFSLKFHWDFHYGFDQQKALAQMISWCRLGDKPLSEPTMV